jgi:hypothetical protein
MTEGSGASVRGALRVVICWQNCPSPMLMMSRRSFRFEGSLMGPASLHTVLGEQAPPARREAVTSKEAALAARRIAGSIARGRRIERRGERASVGIV